MLDTSRIYFQPENSAIEPQHTEKNMEIKIGFITTQF